MHTSIRWNVTTISIAMCLSAAVMAAGPEETAPRPVTSMEAARHAFVPPAAQSMAADLATALGKSPAAPAPVVAKPKQCVTADGARGRACDHTVVLYDSYGDGWNGGTLDVLVNGSVVLDDITLATGGGPESFTFSADTGDTIDLVYTAGSWSYENYYYVYDPRAGLLFADGLSDTTPVGGSTTGVCCTTAPLNDSCATATPVALAADVPIVFTGDNTCASNDCSEVSGAQTWHAFTTTEMLDVEVSYCNTDSAWNNYYIVLADACPCGSLLFADSYEFTSCVNGNITIRYDELPAGTYYLPVLRSPFYGAEGPYEVEVVGDVADCLVDHTVGATVAGPNVWTGNTCGATDDCDMTGSDGSDHVYEVSIPQDGTWAFSLCDSSYDTKLAIGTTCCGEEIGYNDDSSVCGNTLRSYIEASLTAGTYYVTVDGYGTACGDYELEISWVSPCMVDCPVGATPEAEACGDDTNGGCNMAMPAFQPIACGETICGTIWADGGTRDTDWYEITTTEDLTLTLHAEAEFPVVIGLAPTNPCGSGDCADLGTSLDPYALGGECDIISVTTDCLPPGTYWLFVSHQDYYDWPCDSNNDYWITLECTPCTVPLGACCYGDGTCALLAECQCTGTYAGDGTTCDPNPCPQNEQCAYAEEIGEVTDLPFDTTLAAFDGAGTCMYSPNIWYCYTPSCTGLATISLCGSGYDTKLAVYEGCSCDPLGVELACNDDACGLQSEVTIPVFPGQSYLIEVGGYASSTGAGILNVSCEPATGDLVVEALDCQDDAYPGEPGYQVVAELWMRNLTHDVTGFQAFLVFDEGVLSYRTDLSGYSATPFTEHVVPIGATLVGPGQLDLDGSVGSGDLDGTMADSLLATLVFDVATECDLTTIDFRTFEIFESELSYRGYLVDTNVVPVSFWSDDTPPVISGLAVTGGAVDADCEYTVTFAGTVTDNCCIEAADVMVALTETTGNGTFGTPAITKTQVDPMTVTISGTVLVSDLTACPATVQVAVDATDCCGNTAAAQATGDVVDDTPPAVMCDDVVVVADAGAGDACTAAVTMTATAEDNCAGTLPVTYEADFGGGYVAITNPYTFDAGTWPVRASAVDDCGNVGTCDFTVTVQPYNDVVNVALELEGVHVDPAEAPLVRCIKFVARNSVTGVCAAPVHVDVEFWPANGTEPYGNMATAAFQVDCGAWDELCAKDEQHTLYETAALVVVGTQYETMLPLLLLAGDTDNDSDVDINDVTWLMFQWSGGGLPAAGGCPWDGTRDADFNNSGFAGGTSDYLLLSGNWLSWSTCPCAKAAHRGDALRPATRIVTSLPAAELPAPVAAVVDRNGDGVFDHHDVRDFEDASGLPHALSTKMERSARPSPGLKPEAAPRGD